MEYGGTSLPFEWLEHIGAKLASYPLVRPTFVRTCRLRGIFTLLNGTSGGLLVQNSKIPQMLVKETSENYLLIILQAEVYMYTGLPGSLAPHSLHRQSRELHFRLEMYVCEPPDRQGATVCRAPKPPIIYLGKYLFI